MGVAAGVGVGPCVAVAVGVRVAIAVGVEVGRCVAVAVGVWVAIGVGVEVGVAVAVATGVKVGSGVAVAVGAGVLVGAAGVTVAIAVTHGLSASQSGSSLPPLHAAKPAKATTNIAKTNHLTTGIFIFPPTACYVRLP